MAVSIISDSFVTGSTIPLQHTCSGRNVSPALTWSDPPEGTQSFALICDDPDAPRGTFVHWLLYGVPANVRGLSAGIANERELPDGSRQGINDFGKPGYGGPCPPPGHGVHHYSFRVYALDTMPDLAPGARKADLERAMQGHILAQGEIVGLFER